MKRSEKEQVEYALKRLMDLQRDLVTQRKCVADSSFIKALAFFVVENAGVSEEAEKGLDNFHKLTVNILSTALSEIKRRSGSGP